MAASSAWGATSPALKAELGDQARSAFQALAVLKTRLPCPAALPRRRRAPTDAGVRQR